jgi:hypothetical protein
MAVLEAPPASPAQWWELVAALSPAAILLAGVLAGIVGLLTLRQKSLADRRAEWWRRAQWALDASLSDSAARAAMGVNVLEVLAVSDLATDDELEILDIAWQQRIRADAPETAVAPASAAPGQHSPDPAEQRLRVQAARLKVILDRRLGRETPSWVTGLSRQKV